MLKSFVLIISLLVSATLAWANAILDPAAMDTTVSPCQDFYQYSCGSWIKNTQIPDGYSRWARSFDTVSDANLTTLKKVLTDYSNNRLTPRSSYSEKLGDFYASCMNESQAEKDTVTAYKSQLAQIDNVTNAAQLAEVVALLHLEGVGVFFSFGPTADLKTPTIYTAEVDQGGYTLPDSTYYTRTDAEAVKLLGDFKAHASRLLVLAGYSKNDAQGAAADVLSVEKALASHALPPDELQDPTKVYNPIGATALQTMTPSFNWGKYYSFLKIQTPQVINTTEPKFMAELDSLLKNTNLKVLKNYLKWHVIQALSPYLGKKEYDEYFAFHGTVLNGLKVQMPRWKRCVNIVGGSMGEALGEAFVAKTFSPQAKARVLKLIDDLRAAFKAELQTLPWLDAPTRAAALQKLDMITQKVGYPDQWRNYDDLKVSRVTLWQNVFRANIFEAHRGLNKIGGPVDPKEWAMTPQTVNAYYDPSLNQINFPAGILQAPFFSESAPDSNIYGAIGMVIGHEITHGFDTTGSKFDGHGAQNDWWTPGVKTLFDNNAKCLMDQYSKYSPLPTLNVNGKLTVTENIADHGGLKLAFAAYKLASQGQPQKPAVSGLSDDQQFFVSMAQMWCQKQTDESLKRQVSSNPHSPAQYRVIGTVVNSPEFAKAFGCSVGQPMAPASQCSIW